MKEKKLLRWMFIRAAIIIGLYIAITMILRGVLDKTLVSKCLNLSNQLEESSIDAADLDRLIIHNDRPDLVTVKSLDIKGSMVYLTFEPTGDGTGDAYVEVEDPNLGYSIETAYLKVNKSGLIIDTNTCNFTHYREHQLVMVFLTAALAILLLAGYVKSVRELRFSYQSIFYAGLGIWMLIVTGIMALSYAENDLMLILYASLEGAASRFNAITFPFVFIFAVLLTISNISLIRHEGFRTRNALGILISLAMVGGFISFFFLSDVVDSGSEFQINLWNTLIESLETVYAVFECFLIGAIICGSRAAKNKPAFDKDYIVILGCKIRKDGTLYPLIRGRVDRAIRFYNEQLEATGKKAVFIPSGGQGSDEIISEGEAMKRYLLEQGIPEEQIIAETNSKNTRQNMQFSMELMKENSKAVFSTTNFHVFRSGIIAGQVGFETDGMGSPTKWYFWPNAYIREVIGMLSYKWKSLVLVFVPIVTFLTVIRFIY